MTDQAANASQNFNAIAWGLSQQRVRSYEDKVVSRIQSLPRHFQVEQYGEVNYASYNYPLYSVKIGDWQDTSKPTVLISGGVHGYEEAGVESALYFLENVAETYADKYNIIVYPCISPAAYEIDSRWNFKKQDPNRGFKENSNVEECRLFVESLKDMDRQFLMSIDLHETLWNDIEIMKEQARDQGKTDTSAWEDIPTEFFLYEDCPEKTARLGPAIIEAVEKVTPVCKKATISGDRNEGGIIYPENMAAGSEYTEPVMMDSFMRVSGRTPQAFTTETYVEKNTPLQKRIDVQITVIRTALDKASERPAPRM